MATGMSVPGEPPAAGHSPEEWLRWAEEDRRPGERIEALVRSGAIGLYPELAAIVGVPQDPEWHPEGAVDIHTGHVLDAAAAVAEREGLAGDERAVLILAALAHDLGKAGTTRLRDKRGRQRWTSYGHDRTGVPLARRFLRRIGIPERIIARVAPLVEHHMAYMGFRDPAADERAVERLAARLAPATLRQLGYLIEADHSGRPPLPRRLPEAAVRMLDLAREAGVLDGPRAGR